MSDPAAMRTAARPAPTDGSPARPANRVPRVVLLYWVLKIASTTLGETGADHVSMTLGLGYAATIGVFLLLFLALAAWKIGLGRYEPLLYWSAFTASAIAGTAVSDFLDRTLGLGYLGGSLLLVVLLLAVLAAWRLRAGNLSVERIFTAPAEGFYWAAFLVSNTLGTALGDWVADDLGLGFLTAAGVFTALLLGLAALHAFTATPGVVLFWLAFVLTRPFGATFGDLLTKPLDAGGMDLGTLGSSLFFAAVLAVALAVEWRRSRAGSESTPLPPTAGPAAGLGA